MPIAFLGGAIGPAEMLVVLIAVLLLFGPKRLPEMARTLGDAMGKLRRAADEMRDQIMHADQADELQSPTPPVPPPIQPPPSASPVPPPIQPPPGQETVAPAGPQPFDSSDNEQQEPYAG